MEGPRQGAGRENMVSSSFNTQKKKKRTHSNRDEQLTSCLLGTGGRQCCPGYVYVSDSATPWTVAHQAPLSMGFSRQEEWGRLPFPPRGDLPDPGIEPACPALAGGFFIAQPPGKGTL